MQPRRQRKKRAAARPPRPWLPVAIVGTAALLAVVLIIVFSNTGGSSDGKPAKTTPGPTASAVQSGTSLGQDDAPVTMIEYFSFQCSHCADYVRDTAPQIEKDFVETGKLRIEFHALGGEGKLLQASEAAACAGEQNRYLEYYKYLFANRDRGFDKGTLREYARDLGLDTEAFNSCLDSGGGSQQIISDTNDAMEQNLGTPTFFFGQTGTIDKESLPYPGETSIVGAESYDVFRKAIEDELAKAQ